MTLCLPFGSEVTEGDCLSECARPFLGDAPVVCLTSDATNVVLFMLDVGTDTEELEVGIGEACVNLNCVLVDGCCCAHGIPFR